MSSQYTVPTVSSLNRDRKHRVDESIDTYTENFADSQDVTLDQDAVAKKRVENAAVMTDTFYNLVTDFYEYGYSQSFHFTPLYDEKSFDECIADYEKDIAKLLGAKSGMKILDVGCGVGGPGRQIAQSTGATVVGLNYNSYQIERAKKHTKMAQLDHLCSYIKADFCDMNEIEDNSYDGVFAIEATCHAKDPVLVYKEILRVLKPGALFVDATWVMTDLYNPEDPKHVKAKNDVMYGNSLPELRTGKEVLAALREAGLEVLEFRDLARDGDWPWYSTLEGRSCCSVSNFRMSSVGRLTTRYMLGALEMMSLIPKGTSKVSSMLEVAAKSLIESGKMEIFTPLFRCVAKKPTQQ